jgi:hypothetical protein
MPVVKAGIFWKKNLAFSKNKQKTMRERCQWNESIERVFSNSSFIQNKIRNRLETDVANKLVFCYKVLNGKLDTDLD